MINTIDGIGKDFWLVEFETINVSSLEVTKKAFDLLEDADQELLRDKVVLVSVYSYTNDESQHMVRFYTETASVGIDVDGEFNFLFFHDTESGMGLTLREYVNFDAWKNVESNVSLDRAYDIFSGILFSGMHPLKINDIKSAYVLDIADTDHGYCHECTFEDSEGRKIGVEFDDFDNYIAVTGMF